MDIMAESQRASLSAEEQTEHTAINKASWRLLPVLCFSYGIAYIDRVNISFAALQMNQDLHFSATVYGLGGGLFFLSYAPFEVPSNLLLIRFGARRWIARIMLTWGVLARKLPFDRSDLVGHAPTTPLQSRGLLQLPAQSALAHHDDNGL